MEGKGYKSYKNLKGHYSFPDFELSIDHTSPYEVAAAINRIRIRIRIRNGDWC